MNDQIEGKATTRRLFTCFDEQNADVSEDQILIGIDFGTTFSGIAFACLSDEDPKVIVVKSWPGKASNYSDTLNRFLTTSPRNGHESSESPHDHKLRLIQ